jgi:EmrB/QacA subfamily drug resistance transporter
MSRQQRLVLAISILASAVAFLDGAIVNVALPAIQRDLGGGLPAQQWVVDAYLLTLGSFILIAGSLSDLLGRKKILSIGLVGFALASVLCAVAPNSQLLIVFRALQGVAGALLVPSSLALIVATFSGPSQGKAIGSWTAWTGIAFIIGPLLGGLLVDYASWRWIFAINVAPITLILYLLSMVPVKEQRSLAKADITGALLCALGLGGPVFALIEQPHYGWTNPLIYLPLALGLLIFAAFLVYEKRAAYPMLPVELFKNHNFSVGNVATLAVYAGLTASTFLIIVFLQQVAGYSALAAGLSLLPVTIIMFVLSPRFGALSAKLGPRLFMGAGPIIAAVGFLLMAGLQTQVTYWTDLFPAIVIFGVGLSVTVAPLTAAILGDVNPARAGIASAVNNAVARVAGLIAVAAVGAVVASQFGGIVEQNMTGKASVSAIETAKQGTLITSPPATYEHNGEFRQVLSQASVSAFRSGMLVITGLMVAGGIVSLIGIRNQPSKNP